MPVCMDLQVSAFAGVGSSRRRLIPPTSMDAWMCACAGAWRFLTGIYVSYKKMYEVFGQYNRN